MGGQGKSQIALEHCRRASASHRGVFWIDASSKEATERSFDGFAPKIEDDPERLLDGSLSKAALVLEAVQEWEETWLMVFDNYDQPDIFPDIREYMPIRKLLDWVIDMY